MHISPAHISVVLQLVFVMHSTQTCFALQNGFPGWVHALFVVHWTLFGRHKSWLREQYWPIGQSLSAVHPWLIGMHIPSRHVSPAGQSELRVQNVWVSLQVPWSHTCPVADSRHVSAGMSGVSCCNIVLMNNQNLQGILGLSVCTSLRYICPGRCNHYHCCRIVVSQRRLHCCRPDLPDNQYLWCIQLLSCRIHCHNQCLMDSFQSYFLELCHHNIVRPKCFASNMHH